MCNAVVGVKGQREREVGCKEWEGAGHGKLEIEGVERCGIVEVKHMAELNLTNGMCPHCSFTWERVYVIKENTCEVDSLKVQCQFSTTISIIPPSLRTVPSNFQDTSCTGWSLCFCMVCH